MEALTPALQDVYGFFKVNTFIYDHILPHCQIIMLARKWLTANVGACVTEANGTTNMLSDLEIWSDVPPDSY